MKPRIDGIYEFGHALYALDLESHGFAKGDIERVERFWVFSDMHSSTAGFVVRLRDGRRTYIDFKHWHPFEQFEDFRIDVSVLAGDTSLPELGSLQEPVGGWSTETAHLDRMISLPHDLLVGNWPRHFITYYK